MDNGHVLDQTIWNYHFEPGTDKLTPAGLEKLDYLARTPAGPGPAAVPADGPRRGRTTRPTRTSWSPTASDLDAKRAAAVQKYLAARPPAGRWPFEVQVHDPADPGIDGRRPGNAVRGCPAGTERDRRRAAAATWPAAGGGRRSRHAGGDRPAAPAAAGGSPDAGRSTGEAGGPTRGRPTRAMPCRSRSARASRPGRAP